MAELKLPVRTVEQDNGAIYIEDDIDDPIVLVLASMEVADLFVRALNDRPKLLELLKASKAYVASAKEYNRSRGGDNIGCANAATELAQARDKFQAAIDGAEGK